MHKKNGWLYQFIEETDFEDTYILSSSPYLDFVKIVRVRDSFEIRSRFDRDFAGESGKIWNYLF